MKQQVAHGCQMQNVKVVCLARIAHVTHASTPISRGETSAQVYMCEKVLQNTTSIVHWHSSVVARCCDKRTTKHLSTPSPLSQPVQSLAITQLFLAVPIDGNRDTEKVLRQRRNIAHKQHLLEEKSQRALCIAHILACSSSTRAFDGVGGLWAMLRGEVFVNHCQANFRRLPPSKDSLRDMGNVSNWWPLRPYVHAQCPLSRTSITSWIVSSSPRLAPCPTSASHP